MDEPKTYSEDELPDDGRPLIAVADCSVPFGDPGHIVYRDPTADELAQIKADMAADAPPAPATFEERAAAILEKLPPDRVITASEMLAILRPDTANADATPAPAAKEPDDA